MNRKQKAVFLVGLGVIVLMGLMPPWYYHGAFYAYNEGQRSTFEVRAELDYGFLFSPPPPSSRTLRNHPEHNPSVPRIDLSRLLVQWAVTAIATAGIVLVLKDDSGRPHG